MLQFMPIVITIHIATCLEDTALELGSGKQASVHYRVIASVFILYQVGIKVCVCVCGGGGGNYAEARFPTFSVPELFALYYSPLSFFFIFLHFLFHAVSLILHLLHPVPPHFLSPSHLPPSSFPHPPSCLYNHLPLLSMLPF